MSFWSAVKRFSRLHKRTEQSKRPISRPQPQIKSMEIDSPRSVDSDTIYVESGDNIAVSASSATLISSQDGISSNDKSSATAVSDCETQELVDKEDSDQPPTKDESSESATSSSEGSSGTGMSRVKTIDKPPQHRAGFQQASSSRIRTRTVSQRPTLACPQDYTVSSGFQRLECVSIPTLLVPKSQYCEWSHRLPVSDERAALNRILQSKENEDPTLPFHDIVLEDFVIYRPETGTYYPWHMITLDQIISTREACRYLLNGVLRYGESAEYVEAVELKIDAISIDGFEDTDIHSAQNLVYLQTLNCARRLYHKRECWYRLGKPSDEYAHLHRRFLWVADLAKHVIDYLNWRRSSSSETSMVHLNDFRSDFLSKLMEWHGKDAMFRKWLEWYNQTDFRSPINRHREFLFSRAYNLRGHYLDHDLWSDLMVRPTQSRPARGSVEDTIVTPYIRHCCKAMPWRHVLKAQSTSRSVMSARQSQAYNLGFPSNLVNFTEADMAGKCPNTALTLELAVESASFADTSAEEALGRFAIIRMRSAERKKQYDSYSYAYIQGTVRKNRQTLLKVVFLYLPSETPCLDAYYPSSNELFFSDECNCSSDCDPILLTDIVRFVNVNVGALAGQEDGFFMRQKYLQAKNAICTLKGSDLNCPCRRPRSETLSTQRKASERPLQGLSLFAGCGNFDLGLEASGGIEIVTAIDISEYGLKTYAANRSRGLDGLILESVNLCLSNILSGSPDLPAIGNIHFIVAGCPCQGFSRANPDRASDKSMRNCSLLASTLSYIETYLPEYALIENVEAMGAGVKNSGNQAIACLVGMGYQVKRLTLNSCCYCSAQSRNRLFILAAAPKLPLPEDPIESQAPQLKASTVSKGLPEVKNEDLICVPYPDHIPGAKQTPMLGQLIRNVPRYPMGMNFLKSVQGGFQQEPQLDWFRGRISSFAEKTHTAFTRLDPDGFIPTITTGARPSCGRGGGKILHWDQHRTLTVLEARRAQGFPDSDVIIGDPTQQWFQIGNAVNRQVAVALGKVIADSWFSSRDQAKTKIVVDIPAHGNLVEHHAGAKISIPLPVVEPRSSVTAQNSTWHGNDEYYTDAQSMDSQISSARSYAAREDSDEDGFHSGQDSKRYVSDRGSVIDTVSDVNSKSADDQILDRLGTKKFNKDEIEFLKEILRPQPSTTTFQKFDRHPVKQNVENEVEFVKDISRPPQQAAIIRIPNTTPNTYRRNFENLRFSQTQRRETLIVERNSAGVEVPVKMIAERSIEFRTKTPTTSPRRKYGTAEYPIDLETEVMISKRRREEFSDDECDAEDGEVKSWVGKRVRARFDR